jgi:hypothetical protein
MSGDFLKTVLEFKKDNITEEAIELMEPYLRFDILIFNTKLFSVNKIIL